MVTQILLKAAQAAAINSNAAAEHIVLQLFTLMILKSFWTAFMKALQVQQKSFHLDYWDCQACSFLLANSYNDTAEPVWKWYRKVVL